MTRGALLPRSPLTPVLALAALLPACAVGPNYSRPQMPAPPQHRFLEGPAQAESLADLPGWEVAKDPELRGLIREGIAKNLDLHVATGRVEEARALAGVARSFLFPEVNLTGGYGAQQVSRLSKPPQGTKSQKTYQ